MDSGNGHLAAMYGIPTVTLWGVTHPFAGFVPFNQEEHCLLSNRDTYPEIPTSIYGNVLPEGYEGVMKTITPAAKGIANRAGLGKLRRLEPNLLWIQKKSCIE